MNVQILIINQSLHIILQEFFKAAEEGSIERLDELFDTLADADPNMTSVRRGESGISPHRIDAF